MAWVAAVLAARLELLHRVGLAVAGLAGRRKVVDRHLVDRLLEEARPYAS